MREPFNPPDVDWPLIEDQDFEEDYEFSLVAECPWNRTPSTLYLFGPITFSWQAVLHSCRLYQTAGTDQRLTYSPHLLPWVYREDAPDAISLICNSGLGSFIHHCPDLRIPGHRPVYLQRHSGTGWNWHWIKATVFFGQLPSVVVSPDCPGWS